MKKKNYNENLNEKLFGLDYLSDNSSEEEQEKRIDFATKIIQEYGEQAVFEAWFSYLQNSVNSVRAAWSFMLWFYNFNGEDFKIKNPYPFLGLLFNKLGLSLDDDKKSEDEKQMFDTFDSIYASMLTKSGYFNESNYFDVNPYRDDHLREEINKIHETC